MRTNLSTNPSTLLENTIIRLLASKQQFYAEILMRMVRVPTNQIPTAGVCVKGGQVFLYYNADFLSALDPVVRQGVLKHECLHLLHQHLGRAESAGIRNSEGVPNRGAAMTWNLAADCAINQYIPELAGFEDKITPASLSKLCGGKKLEEHRETEYYYAALVKAGVGQGGPGDPLSGEGGPSPLDDHGMWSQGDVSEEVVKATVRDLAQRAKAAAAGTVPSELVATLEALCESRVDWRAILRNFVANAQETVAEPTRMRRNRRFGLEQPGQRREPKLHLAVAVDTSGSVADEELQAFFSEIETIAALGNEVTVIEADAAVHNVYSWKRGQVPQPKGRGGTAYQPAFDKAAELRADAVVYFGDMDCADTPSQPTIPTLWACVRGTPPVPWGARLRLDGKSTKE
jgi:predicted metal-dependent peptidase